MTLAALGLLSPVIAGAAMALSSVSVVGNALSLRRWRGADVRMMDIRSTCRDERYDLTSAAPTVAVMSSTMLTKRRAVDHCRVRSALCRMS